MMKFVSLAAVAMMAATPALAASTQVGAIKGSVLVNAKPAVAGALKAGDRVVAAKGSAQVKFADGCVVNLKAGSMVTVGAKSPCAAGAGVVSANGAQAAQGEGMFGGVTAVEAAGYIAVAVGLGIGIADVADDDPDSTNTSTSP